MREEFEHEMPEHVHTATITADRDFTYGFIQPGADTFGYTITDTNADFANFRQTMQVRCPINVEINKNLINREELVVGATYKTLIKDDKIYLVDKETNEKILISTEIFTEQKYERLFEMVHAYAEGTPMQKMFFKEFYDMVDRLNKEMEFYNS